MRGRYGCRQCQCEPDDKHCSCLCHEGEQEPVTEQEKLQEQFNLKLRDLIMEYYPKIGLYPVIHYLSEHKIVLTEKLMDNTKKRSVKDGDN